MTAYHIVKLTLIASVAFTAQPGHALTSADYLRVAVQCPESRENGILATIEENMDGVKARSRYYLVDRKFDRFVSDFSEDGITYRPDHTFTRTESEANGEHDFLIAWEKGIDEVIRNYCEADPESLIRINDLMEQNRQLLARERKH